MRSIVCLVFSSAISSVSLRSSSARSRQCIGSLIKDAGIVQVTSRCRASHSSPKHQTPEYPASGSPQLCPPSGGSLERISMSRVSDSEGDGNTSGPWSEKNTNTEETPYGPWNLLAGLSL